MTASPARRVSCTACLRPGSTCICAWVTTVQTDVEVVILQHPLEVTHAKNSGRLLHLCLPGSRLLVGETFDADSLAAALVPDRRNLLLYPRDAEVSPAQTFYVPSAPRHSGLPDFPAMALRLIVLDATWPKSRKMLYLNPLLQQLPRLSLDDVPPSRYRMRRAHKPDQLSTLEAACAALAQLESQAKRKEQRKREGGNEKFAPLLFAFDGFVADQLARMPARRPQSIQSPRSISPARRTPSGAS